MQPYHWFGLLLVTSSLALRLPLVLRVATPVDGLNASVYVFLLAGLLATFATGAKGTSLAHLVHLVFGVSVMFSIIANTHLEKDRNEAISWLVYGTLAAAAWGIVELLCSAFGVPYPDWIFNNSAGEFVSESTSLWLGIPRLSSVATEPSYLVRSLVPVLCLIMGMWLNSIRTGLRIDFLKPLRWKVTLLLAITVLSTSTLGIIALFIASVAPLLFAKSTRIYILCVYSLVGSMVVYLFYTNPLIAALAEELLFGKFQLGSGTLRIVSVAEAADAFSAHPWLGSGPGLVTSHDLVLKLLSNFGVVGASLFLLMLVTAMRRGWFAVSKRRGTAQAAILVGLLSANLMLWIMDALAGVSYQYGIFWALLALLLSAARIRRGSLSRSIQNSRAAHHPKRPTPGFHHHHRPQ